MSDSRIEPQQVIDLAEAYVSEQLRDFERYGNRSPFDSSSVWSLHQLARDIYALGAADGVAQEMNRASRQRQREREAVAE